MRGYKLEEWEFVEIPSRRIFRETVTNADRFAELVSVLQPEKGRENWPIPILELNYAEDLSEEAEAFIKMYANKLAVIFEAVVPSPVELEIPEIAESDEPITMEGVMDYVISEPGPRELAKSLAARPDDAERIITNKLEELLRDTSKETVVA